MSKLTFVWNKEWTDAIRKIGDREWEDKLIGMLIDYATYGEKPNEFANGMTEFAFNTYAAQIERISSKYNDSIEFGQKNGRKKSYNGQDIAVLMEQGLNGKMIAAELGISEDAVYRSDEWKNREKERVSRKNTFDF